MEQELIGGDTNMMQAGNAKCVEEATESVLFTVLRGEIVRQTGEVR